MLVPMLMMLVLTLMNLPDAFDAAAYVVAADANAESKMPNATRHLAGANAVLMLLMMIAMMLIVVMMLLILRLSSYYNVFAITGAKV